MINITEEYVNSAAPNQNAISTGWGLVKKNNFVKLNISEDETVIYGECIGSGASNYLTSVDFLNKESPNYRCTCPSRQFPCKHAIGLMFAYISGKKFETSEFPPEIVEKREKAERREERKKTDTEIKPVKVNRNALLKKFKVQLDGLELLEKVTYSIVQSGLGTINSKSLTLLEDQARQLGNYYIPGAQSALREFIVLFKNAENIEKIKYEAADCLTSLYALCKKGKDYLNKRINDPDMSPDINSAIEEWLGHAWQLSELRDLGLIQQEAELAQLSFNSYYSEARQEFVDSGLWMNLNNGKVAESRTYRPVKAARHIREEDSFYSILQLKELFIYPGDLNPRIRWENSQVRDIKSKDYQLIKTFAYKNYQEVIKPVKNQIKNPLSDKNPVFVLQFKQIGKIDNDYIIEDINGQRIILSDNLRANDPPSVKLLSLVSRSALYDQAILVRFFNNMENMKLSAQPLSIVTDNGIIRLTY